MGSATTDIAVTSIRLDRARLDALKRVADANHRSVSQEVRWLIDRHLEANPLPKAA